MNPNFPNWYRSAAVNPSSEQLNAAWDVTEKLSKKIEVPELLSAVASAFRANLLEKWPTDLFPKLTDINPSFAVDDRRHEISIIAVSAGLLLLINNSEGTDENALIFALATKCAELRGSRAPELVPYIIGESKKYLAHAAESIRNRRASSPAPGYTKEMKAVIDAGNQGVPQLHQAVVQLNEYVLKHQRYTKAEVDRLERLVKIQSEETDMLWWLLSRRAEIAPGSEKNAGNAALVLGHQLADITLDPPGPLSAVSMIQVALSDLGIDSSKKISLADAVNQSAKEWRTTIVAPTNRVEQVLCPISTAISKSAETAGKTGWYEPFESVVGISPSIKLTISDISAQLYDEQLLQRIMIHP